MRTVSLPNPTRTCPRELLKSLPREQVSALQELAKRGYRLEIDNDASLPVLGAELPWEEWLVTHFPHVCTSPFAERHRKLWSWFDSLVPGQQSRPRVEVWPRGGAKSSTAELGVCRVGVKLARRFVLYVSETQPQADKHVQSISTLFESIGVERALNRYGASKGWARDQLRTAHGFNVAAMGLDAAVRGVKLDQFRPDLIVLDDFDGRHDTEETRKKKIDTITTTLLPAGSSDCAVLVVQNLVYADSIVAQLVDGRADFLHDRTVSQVHKAVIGLTYDHVPTDDGRLRFRVTGGDPTWEGQNLAVCEYQINRDGIGAFLRESQQEVNEEEGGLWSRALIEATRLTLHPPLHRIAVAIDPNTTEGGDEAGIVVAGVGKVGTIDHGYLLEDATVAGGPKKWADAAVAAYNRHKADVLVAEQNNGGQMVSITIGTVPGAPPVKLVHASRGKITRAEPVQKLYEDGRFHHVGHFQALEKELCTYRPGMPSPNRLDACVWAGHELMLTGPVPHVLRMF